MRFWDSSAIVPLLVAEPGSAEAHRLLASDDRVVVWWATGIECVAALARRERAGPGATPAITAALGRLRMLEPSWAEIEPTPVVRRIAVRLLRTHALRTGDALQLAAALVAADQDEASLPFVCLDDRLSDAARREGFSVVP